MIAWRRLLQTLLESLRLLAAGNAPRIPQDNARATYASKLKREHGLIDWSESAEAIGEKFVRTIHGPARS
jgi:Methionyl-tRNA formyltransferase